MTATPANELGHHTTPRNNSAQPKTFTDYTTPLSTDEESTNTTTTQPPVAKKKKPSSTTSANFLSTLTSFDMENNHGESESSINSHSIQSIFHGEKNEKKSQKGLLDQKVSQLLDIPLNTVEDELSWPYNVESLNGLINLQIEKEKTKQCAIKKELGSTAVTLLNLVRELNIDGGLIPFLFVSETMETPELKQQIDRIQNNPTQVLAEIVERSQSLNQTPSGTKRKYSDTQLPSFSETTQNIQSSNLLISPNKSPIFAHKRVVSDSTNSSCSKSNIGTISPSNNDTLSSTSTAGIPGSHSKTCSSYNHTQSQQHSPTTSTLHATAPTQYPLFYTTPQPIPQPSLPQTQHSHSANKSNMNDATSPKYQILLSHNYAQGGVNYIPQPYPYYVASAASIANHQYMVSAPAVAAPSTHHSAIPRQQYNGHSALQQQQQQQRQQQQQQQQLPSPQHRHPVPSHHFESPDSAKNVFKSEKDDTVPAAKKPKNSKGSGSINFMITTPKNPPARKYNNPHKEK